MVRAVLGICLLAGVVGGCGGPENASIEQRGNDDVFRWDGPAARLCITEPNAYCPNAKDDKVAGGKAFWVIDATCYNGGDGFPAPVVYGHTPDCAKDVTADHGGMAGGTPLKVGQEYLLTVTGFSSSRLTKLFTHKLSDGGTEEFDAGSWRPEAGASDSEPSEAGSDSDH